MLAGVEPACTAHGSEENESYCTKFASVVKRLSAVCTKDTTGQDLSSQ